MWCPMSIGHGQWSCKAKPETVTCSSIEPRTLWLQVIGPSSVSSVTCWPFEGWPCNCLYICRAAGGRADRFLRQFLSRARAVSRQWMTRYAAFTAISALCGTVSNRRVWRDDVRRPSPVRSETPLPARSHIPTYTNSHHWENDNNRRCSILLKIISLKNYLQVKNILVIIWS